MSFPSKLRIKSKNLNNVKKITMNNFYFQFSWQYSKQFEKKGKIKPIGKNSFSKSLSFFPCILS